MTDERKRPRFPRPRDYREDETPSTERVPFIPPPPPTPSEPFRLLTANEVPRASWLIPADFREQIQKLIAGHNQILQTQRKMALQLDGFGVAMNDRLDVFHRELALLRASVATSAGRIDRIDATLGQKVGAVAAAGTRGTLWLVIGSVLSQVLPQYGELIRSLLGGH